MFQVKAISDQFGVERCQDFTYIHFEAKKFRQKKYAIKNKLFPDGTNSAALESIDHRINLVGLRTSKVHERRSHHK